MAVLTRRVQGNLNCPTNYFCKTKVNRQLAIIDIFLLFNWIISLKLTNYPGMGFDFWAQNGVVGRAESWWLLKLKALCCRLQVKVVVGCRHSWTQSVCRLHYYTIVCNIGAAVALVTVELEAAVELSNFPLCSSTRDCRRCDWKTSDCLKMNEHHNHHRLAINNSLDKWDQQPIKPFFASFFSQLWQGQMDILSQITLFCWKWSAL